MKDPPITTAATVTASEFRAKVVQMKNWTPNRTPTNRDRLELYALHKQAVASDAPEMPSHVNSTIKGTPSPAERAKLNAWKTKRGLSQSQAMAAYINEAERQIRTYGTCIPSTTTPTNTPNESSGNDSGNGNGTSDEHGRGNGYGHGHGTDASTTSSSVLLTPRGLAAVPLLCAAAAESRGAYLKRLEQTAASSIQDDDGNGEMSSSGSGGASGGVGGGGWWMRQEPLCGDPGTISALPEIIVLTIAIFVERLSLYLSSSRNGSVTKDILDTLALRPGVVQSLLWPLHNVLLVVWILIIFLSTVTGSAILTVKTLLLGSMRTGVSLEDVFAQEIVPCKRGTASLCARHQAATVRFLGLVLYPLGMVCELACSVVENVNVNVPGGGNTNTTSTVLGQKSGLLLGSGAYLLATFCLWWYWFIMLPWVAIGGLVMSISFGWCFGLIELANI